MKRRSGKMKCQIVDYDHFGRGITKIASKIVFVPKCRKNEMVDIDIVKERKNY